MEAAREIFDLAGVARAELFTGAPGPAHGAWREPAGAAGLFKSVLLVERLLTEAGRDPRAQRAARLLDEPAQRRRLELDLDGGKRAGRGGKGAKKRDTRGKKNRVTTGRLVWSIDLSQD